MKRAIGIYLLSFMTQTALISLARAQNTEPGSVTVFPPASGTWVKTGTGTLSLNNGLMVANASFSTPMERGTFLGVVTTPVAPALREQLKLKNGLGVLVESVENDSPAAAAGVKQYDVLEKLDDQLLINAQQLAVLVRTHAANDKVAITLIRQGQRQTLTATLTEKDLPPIDVSNAWGLPAGETTWTGGTLTIMSNLNNTVTDKTRSMVIKALQPTSPREMRMTTSDDRYRIDYSTKDGKSKITVKDNNGATLYDGPADTEEQQQALPADVLIRLKAIVDLPKNP